MAINPFQSHKKWNFRYIVSGEKTQTLVRVETIRDIKKGEEVTVCYSPDYFGDDNVDCRCPTCQKFQKVHKQNVPETEVAAENQSYSDSDENEVETQVISSQEETRQIFPDCAPIITSNEVRTRFLFNRTNWLLFSLYFFQNENQYFT